jgi:hypothetical protein
VLSNDIFKSVCAPANHDLSVQEYVSILHQQEEKEKEIDNTTWMSRFSSHSLLELVLPSTHNSASSSVCFSRACTPVVPLFVSLDFIRKITITQNTSIYKQLIMVKKKKEEKEILMFLTGCTSA